jgi:Transposase DDE domain
VAHLIGFAIPIVLDVEMLAPAEGEIVAARRLLERLLERYARFFDAVAGDALYLEGPLFNLCRARGKHVLAVLKDNNPALLAEARALLQGTPDWSGEQDGRAVRLWDQAEFKSDSIQEALRIVRSTETGQRRRRIGKRWVLEPIDVEWFWATTIPQQIIPARQLRQIGHERWSIENRVFNTLSQHWGLNHCFRHEAAAIVNFVLILTIAHTLVACFARRNLKSPLRHSWTLLDVARQILLGVAALECRWRAPWLQPRDNAPP